MTTLAELTSPVRTPGASLFSKGARFGQGATHLFPSIFRLGWGAGHTRGGLGSVVC